MFAAILAIAAAGEQQWIAYIPAPEYRSTQDQKIPLTLTSGFVAPLCTVTCTKL
jgi:hypothetical protein